MRSGVVRSVHGCCFVAHPSVIAAYQAGNLETSLLRGRVRKGLTRVESALVRFLERSARRAASPCWAKRALPPSRQFGTHFFNDSGPGHVLLWQHLCELPDRGRAERRLLQLRALASAPIQSRAEHGFLRASTHGYPPPHDGYAVGWTCPQGARPLRLTSRTWQATPPSRYPPC